MAARSVSRPKFVGLFALALALWPLVLGCVAQQEEEGGGGQEESAEAPFTGSFVGDDISVIDDNSEVGAFLALVAQEPEEGADQQEVRAYLCDGAGKSINEWFNEGSVEGTEFDLTTDSGARLVGGLKQDVDSSWVSGQIVLADGTVLGFGAPPATGIAGLYDVTISSDGSYSGTSERGGQLEGRVADEPQEDGSYLVTGTATLPEGEEQEFRATVGGARSVEKASELRVIFLPDGRSKGGPKGGGGEGFINQDAGT